VSIEYIQRCAWFGRANRKLKKLWNFKNIFQIHCIGWKIPRLFVVALGTEKTLLG
jgi:hypothetical protein